jgi:tetratricopeptide (TPR) repeat protein
VLDSLFTSLAPPPAGSDGADAAREGDAYAMAADYLAMGLYERAAAEASRALVRGAPRAEGFTLLGDIYARQGLHGEALERYREAKREAGTSVRPAIGEATSLLAMERGAEARPIAEALLAASPPDIEVLMLVAAARADTGDPAAALDALEQARRLAPLRADVHQRTGDIAASLGDFDGAIAAYRHALELDQDFAVVRYQLARLLRAKGMLREAESELEGALDAVPTYAEATLELSSMRRAAGRADEALDLLITLLERDPYHFDALLALAETLLAIGRKRDAATAIRRILRFDPQHVGALYYDGILLTDQKRFRDAIDRWRQVIELDPSSEFARRARREARTAMDLDTIFAATAAAGV